MPQVSNNLQLSSHIQETGTTKLMLRIVGTVGYEINYQPWGLGCESRWEHYQTLNFRLDILILGIDLTV